MLRNQFVDLAIKLGFSFNKSDPVRVKKGFTMKSTGAFFNANLTSRAEVQKWMTTISTLCDSHIKRFRLWQSKIQSRV